MKTVEVRMLVTDGSREHLNALLDRICATTGVLNAVALTSDGTRLVPDGPPVLNTPVRQPDDVRDGQPWNGREVY